MSTLTKVSSNKMFGGLQEVYSHERYYHESVAMQYTEIFFTCKYDIGEN